MITLAIILTLTNLALVHLIAREIEHFIILTRD
jgi:hypothetical protein